MNYYQGSVVPPVTRSCSQAQIGWPQIGWPQIGWPQIGWPQIGWLWAGEFPLVQSQWLHGSPQRVLMISLAVRPGVMQIAKMFESLQVQVLDCEVGWVAYRQLALAPRAQSPQ
jgi:hypothetical protein